MNFLIKFLTIILALVLIVDCKSPRKIKSGLRAGYNEFPHQVSLRLNGKHICGGSIIDTWHILTAAHCVVGEQYTGDIKILSGTVDQVNAHTGQVHDVARIVYHKDFNAAFYENDIAIITLKSRMVFNQYQKPITLSRYDVPIGTPVVVSGWGSQKINSGLNSQYLQKLHTKIISNEECQKRDGKFTIGHEIICARKSQGYSICQGDSGGPLIYKGVLIGIAARSFCDGVHPDIFTRVSSYIKWISWNTSTR
ncbi:chymotrypsin-1-like [Aphidius gifuensis]|uniref:chymotrypsin-1-like n=1 Tax=Aphidius gifuensis TaxID=684658 RepID=UPI001CDBEACC|nr:chymotrypsin-1-like [Aphidius gifuensis]